MPPGAPGASPSYSRRGGRPAIVCRGCRGVARGAVSADRVLTVRTPFPTETLLRLVRAASPHSHAGSVLQAASNFTSALVAAPQVRAGGGVCRWLSLSLSATRTSRSRRRRLPARGTTALARRRVEHRAGPCSAAARSTPPALSDASLCKASIARLNAPAPASPWNKLSAGLRTARRGE